MARTISSLVYLKPWSSNTKMVEWDGSVTDPADPSVLINLLGKTIRR